MYNKPIFSGTSRNLPLPFLIPIEKILIFAKHHGHFAIRRRTYSKLLSEPRQAWCNQTASPPAIAMHTMWCMHSVVRHWRAGWMPCSKINKQSATYSGAKKPFHRPPNAVPSSGSSPQPWRMKFPSPSPYSTRGEGNKLYEIIYLRIYNSGTEDWSGNIKKRYNHTDLRREL